MAIKIYDSMQRAVVELETREPGKVSMYACGPTVYNYVHIGNARTTLWYDFIRRYLTYRGYDVTFVSNYTDVDDKIIERANIEGIEAEGIAKKYEAAFEQDMSALGIHPPDVICRATTHIEDMVKAIQGLIERGAAYEVEGDVFFAVENFKGYGKLSHRTLDDMRAGERVEPHHGKRHPLDFALWKSAKEGEPSWESPWGHGRPGWHIECSVMASKYLGMGFDLHGGGSDLIFPHHENEIAQAEALAESEPFARHWMHSGMVQMDAEKMSKSLGNVALAHDLLEIYPGEVLRYWALSGSYRSQPVFSEGALEDATQSYERWKTFLVSARHALGDEMPDRPVAPVRPIAEPLTDDPLARFIAALDDDFNSAEAFAVVHEVVGEGNKAIELVTRGEAGAREQLTSLASTVLELSVVLGFDYPSAGGDSELVGGLIEYLLALREQARADKAFDRADEIRNKLVELGVTIEDTPAGARWRV